MSNFTDRRITDIWKQFLKKRFVAVSTPGGSDGQLLWVKIDGDRLQARCFGDVSSGECMAAQLDTGEWLLTNSQVAKPQEQSSRNIELRRTKSKKKEEKLAFLALFGTRFPTQQETGYQLNFFYGYSPVLSSRHYLSKEARVITIESSYSSLRNGFVLFSETIIIQIFLNGDNLIAQGEFNLVGNREITESSFSFEYQPTQTETFDYIQIICSRPNPLNLFLDFNITIIYDINFYITNGTAIKKIEGLRLKSGVRRLFYLQRDPYMTDGTINQLLFSVYRKQQEFLTFLTVKYDNTVPFRSNVFSYLDQIIIDNNSLETIEQFNYSILQEYGLLEDEDLQLPINLKDWRRRISSTFGSTAFYNRPGTFNPVTNGIAALGNYHVDEVKRYVYALVGNSLISQIFLEEVEIEVDRTKYNIVSDTEFGLGRTRKIKTKIRRSPNPELVDLIGRLQIRGFAVY